MTIDTDPIAEIEAVAAEVSTLLPHTFSIVTTLADGSTIPAEALSEDHTIGLYRTAIPRKMRESLDGFKDSGHRRFSAAARYRGDAHRQQS